MEPYATARAMLADLAAKKISARELLAAHVARHEKLAKTLNAVVATDLARAEKNAHAIDEARAKGAPLGPLAGLPMTIKDVFDVEGLPAVCGNTAFMDRSKNCREADVVSAVRKAGAVIWGKTNVPLMAGDMQSYNDVYGTTNNPYDVTRTPGGSSGGAAAALAASITPLEIGSDIGGSLRHPANFCGVCSLKPTWGVLSQRGHVPPLPENYIDADLNVTGPMARNIEDLKLLWSVLRGSPAIPCKDIRGARIALWDEEAGFPLSREVHAAIVRAAKALGEAGAHVERAKPFAGTDLMPSYGTLLVSIIACGFPIELYHFLASSKEADLKAIAAGAGVYSMEFFRARATASFREVTEARVQQQAFKDKLVEFFATGWDALLMPLGPVPAFTHRHEGALTDRTLEVDGETVPYMHLLDWISLATALHAPALAVPAGQTRAGLPVGAQLIGPWDGENRLFDFAAALEDGLGGFSPPTLEI